MDKTLRNEVCDLKNKWFFKQYWSEGKITCQAVVVALIHIHSKKQMFEQE